MFGDNIGYFASCEGGSDKYLLYGSDILCMSASKMWSKQGEIEFSLKPTTFFFGFSHRVVFFPDGWRKIFMNLDVEIIMNWFEEETIFESAVAAETFKWRRNFSRRMRE